MGKIFHWVKYLGGKDIFQLSSVFEVKKFDWEKQAFVGLFGLESLFRALKSTAFRVWEKGLPGWEDSFSPFEN